jgi:hypothetical protein
MPVGSGRANNRASHFSYNSEFDFFVNRVGFEVRPTTTALELVAYFYF